MILLGGLKQENINYNIQDGQYRDITTKDSIEMDDNNKTHN